METMMDWRTDIAAGLCVLLLVVPISADAQQPGRASLSPDSTLEQKVKTVSPLPVRLGPSSLLALGREYEARGKTRRALDVLERGLAAGETLDSTRIAIADAFLRALDEETVPDHLEPAARAYRQILAQAGPNPVSDRIVDRHVARLIPILPTRTERSLVRGSTAVSPGTWTFESNAGDQLLRWWRQRDPLPATVQNERMETHIQRVSHAQTHFACKSDDCSSAGWDDRGTVYVRFGPPDKRDSVTYNEAEFNLDVFRFGVPVSRSDFPDNELWAYPRIDHSGRYLFVEERDRYRIARTNDLLPQQLQTGYGGRSDRELNKSVSAMAALRHIYQKLSPHHSDYADRYAQIDYYAGWQEEQAALARLGVLPESQTRTVGKGVGQKMEVGRGPGSNSQLPNQFVSGLLKKSKVKDRQAAQRRRENMPTEYDGGKEVASLPVALRTARFLTEAGSTEVQVVWSHPAEAFSLPGTIQDLLDNPRVRTFDGHLVQVQGVKYDPAYRRLSTSGRSYFVARSVADQGGRLDVQTLSMKGGEDRFHVRLQWDHVLALNRSGSRIQQGPLTRRSVKRIDSVDALPNGGDALVMSDLLPGRLQDGEVPRKENIEPYPFSSLGGEAQITLYFELYNLALGENEKTKYTVEYSVTQGSEEGDVFGLFDGDDPQETKTRSTYRGQRSQTEEFVTLDLANWDETGDQPLTVAVRVTDEITGKEAKRTIQFSAPE